MSIALIAGIVVVFIALIPTMAKAVRGKERRADGSGDGGTSYDSGTSSSSSSSSSDCGSDGGSGSGGDGGCD